MKRLKREERGISSHLRREAKIMIWFVIAVLLVGIVALVVAPRVKEFWEVDRCLDSGGSFNRKTNECEK